MPPPIKPQLSPALPTPPPSPSKSHPPPKINQDQVAQLSQSIQALASTPLPSIPPTRTGINAILPSTATLPSPSPPRPNYSPISTRTNSPDNSTSDEESPLNVARREAILETSGSSNTSKGSYSSRSKDRRSHSKRKREKTNLESSGSSGQQTKRH